MPTVTPEDMIDAACRVVAEATSALIGAPPGQPEPRPVMVRGFFTDESLAGSVTALRDDLERRFGREDAREALLWLSILIEHAPKADLVELLRIARDELAERSEV